MTTFDHDDLRYLAHALRTLDAGFTSLPDLNLPNDPRVATVLEEVATRMRDNYPYQHPFYLGQMLKPPHAMARLAYALAMYINPNNHALDGGRASSRMEREAVSQIAEMFGWETHLGHLTGGGTLANFEALWVAREETRGRAVAASAQSHYTHRRLTTVLDMPFVSVPVDDRGCMDIKALEQLLILGDVGTVVATLGTTAAGTVDSLPGILALKQRFGFRLHVDAAYGGYYVLANNLAADTARSFECIGEADSIVLDPHKHGLQPYGCGCVLFRDPMVGRHYKHDSPYTYFSSDELHLGEISLECSRAGAAAVALWSTIRLLPLKPGGEFAAMLEDSREAVLMLYRYLQQHEQFVPIIEPQLDIVVWAIRAPSASLSSRYAREIFDAAARIDVHLALATFPRSLCERAAPVDEWDADQLTCLRACVMKPEHREWMPEILARLDRIVVETPSP
jgi:tyrosine decarboxylase / aspartate 1-decarboxylase